MAARWYTTRLASQCVRSRSTGLTHHISIRIPVDCRICSQEACERPRLIFGKVSGGISRQSVLDRLRINRIHRLNIIFHCYLPCPCLLRLGIGKRRGKVVIVSGRCAAVYEATTSSCCRRRTANPIDACLDRHYGQPVKDFNDQSKAVDAAWWPRNLQNHTNQSTTAAAELVQLEIALLP